MKLKCGRWYSFARRVTFAQGDTFDRRNSCMASLIARRYICIATFLQNVIFARRYIFKVVFMHCKIINNQSILNIDSFLQALTFFSEIKLKENQKQNYFY